MAVFVFHRSLPPLVLFAPGDPVTSIDVSNTADSPKGHSPTNRLAVEKSPYLQQHAHNPVDWFPWGDEAFAAASSSGKPILLSIGYSTCHWCHVMERESFASASIGDYLREHFVCIKVDREERPDIDKIYMSFVQMTSGTGGWPLNVFLTPDLKPFYGGTYFPPEARHNRPGFRALLERVVELWTTRREDLLGSAADLATKLAELAHQDPDNAFPTGPRELHGGGQSLLSEFDPVHGGFGGAPKFPRPTQPLFLLRYSRRFGDAEGVQAVLHTCDRMAAGGIYDHLGGGFARYGLVSPPDVATGLRPFGQEPVRETHGLDRLAVVHRRDLDPGRHPKALEDRLGVELVLGAVDHQASGAFPSDEVREGPHGHHRATHHQEKSRHHRLEHGNAAATDLGFGHAPKCDHRDTGGKSEPL